MTVRGAVVKVEVANFCAAMDTLTDQDVVYCTSPVYLILFFILTLTVLVTTIDALRYFETG